MGRIWCEANCRKPFLNPTRPILPVGLLPWPSHFSSHNLFIINLGRVILRSSTVSWLEFSIFPNYPRCMNCGELHRNINRKIWLEDGWPPVFTAFLTRICFFVWIGFSKMDGLFLQYDSVVQALRKGDLRLLRHALQEHEDRCFLYVSVIIYILCKRNFLLLIHRKLDLSWTLPLWHQVLKIRCISCPGEARAPSLPKISQENVGSFYQ